MNKVGFYTLGCKVNQYDTEAMLNLFTESGYEIVDFDEQADCYVINTCTVTHQGARKSRQMARRAKRRNSEAVVAVVGCYPQISPKEVLESTGVDLVVGTDGRSQIVDLVEQAQRATEALNFVQEVEAAEDFEELPITEAKQRTRASLKVEDGCNNFCAYCIIPYTRGRVRSRELKAAVAEAQRLVDNDFKELVLTGIHLGAYGEDKDEGLDLLTLIKELLSIADLKRLRLSSIEVTEVEEELINLIAAEEKLCSHLHLPLQSGSNRILEAMNRDYSVEEYVAKVEEIRELIPEIAITTDVIVGFPGEKEEDFLKTYQTIESLEFSDLHIFKYSQREGTPAAKFPEQVHSKVKKERSAKLHQLGAKLSKKYKQQFIGHKLKVLFEAERDNESGLLTGLSDNYLRILAEGEDKYQECLVTVRVKEVHQDYLLAEICE
ncbi:tRNA (N(6)-L-threonylcarbamoyladenosine(37)-C(2))-methylthiotransferase MtaB [Fuchsiella alkaliacetigena]|uniref:tRNA (N(6)-L-threonylcarbamoyladenosine(37)-C(2))- methylthiotransferase MtaB n=1 Tax=Fuchsiella alkaliacetigena TaxID=957042 RepID=UPI002009E5E4|nr:tRNA (N(6)-L-threonylcarbamoyladenosine(37)-C(2))-methylthiotransferase MtaB [Fuchsiella alkaliacetigena]MCK8825152.1 tRNA (N(6)-L-threonylcarbamoyladenosine(37)-C(2))-methylthiotransferase MtaB [Fuchsiella alkaliacetigena]